jgi:nucleoside phosphorylase
MLITHMHRRFLYILFSLKNVLPSRWFPSIIFLTLAGGGSSHEPLHDLAVGDDVVYREVDCEACTYNTGVGRTLVRSSGTKAKECRDVMRLVAREPVDVHRLHTLAPYI